MAKFDVALQHLFALEGGWVKHPADPGGETYRGISRRYHPDWPGWRHIDAQDRSPQQLDALAGDFYRGRYWGVLGPAMDQVADSLGSELLDQAVHTTPGRAVEHLQRALNALNRQGKLWPDVSVDGRLGPGTAAAAAKAEAEGRTKAVVGTMNVIQGAYLLERVEKTPTKEEFWLGWLRRLY